MATVLKIPAKFHPITHLPETKVQKRRVAAYARVSTDSEEQQTSYAAQVDRYTKYIQERADWEFVAVYTDEGISALNTKHRDGFNRMVADALDGKIDLIVTKSVSRFARNTVDSLTTVRKLKEKGVEVFFEKENIYTLDSKGELLITIMSSLAQEESRSISENVTWGQRKRMADGKVSLPYKHFLGYRKGADGLPEIVPEEAEIVRNIYRWFMEGKTPTGIARTLTEQGVPTPAGKEQWCSSTVKSILTNEKYKGSALLQKRFTVDFLTKKSKVNEGEVPQYYIEDDHEAIIPKDLFMSVQEEMARRSSERDMNGRRQGFSANHAFSHMVTCECCGEHFRRLHWNNRGKKTIVWRCKTRLEDRTRCMARTVSEDTLQEAFVEAINEMLGNSDEYLKKLKSNLKTAISLANPQSVEALADRMRQLQQELIDLTESGTNYDDLSEEILRLRELQEQTNMDEAAKNERKKRIRELANFIDSQPRAITEFDEALAKKLLEGVRVGETYLEFQFKSGARIVIENE